MMAEAHFSGTGNLPQVISHKMIPSELSNELPFHVTHCQKDSYTSDKPNSILNTCKSNDPPGLRLKPQIFVAKVGRFKGQKQNIAQKVARCLAH